MNKTIKNYTAKSLKKNKVKMGLIVLAIALSTFLINMAGILVSTYSNEYIKNVRAREGAEDGVFLNITGDKFDILKNNIMVKDVGQLYSLDDKKHKVDERIKTNLYYLPEEYNDYFGISLEDGSMPEKKDEVLISKEMSRELDKSSDDYISFDNHKYKISGVINKCTTIELNKMCILVSKEYFYGMEHNSDMNKVYVNLKEEKDIKTDIKTLGNDLGLDENDIKVNLSLAKALKFGVDDIILVAAVALIILLTAIISIYNIFNISVKQRTQEFGLLESLGATKHNIKSILRKEGIMVCLRGIPIGLIASVIIGYVVIPYLSTTKAIEMKMQYIYILLAIVVVSIAVFISSSLSARTACRISPLSAINYIEGKADRGRRKSEDVVGLSRLSRINLFRNKKRTAVTILSISLCLVLFIVISTLVSSIDVEKMVDGNISGDYEISSNLDNRIEDTLLTDEDVNNIKSVNGAKDVSTMKEKHIKAGYNGENVAISGFNEKFINKYINKPVSGEINVEKMNSENGIILLEFNNGEKEAAIGDKIKIDTEEGEKEFTLQGFVDNTCWRVGGSILGLNGIVTEKCFKDNFGECRNEKVMIDIDKNNDSEIKNHLQKYKSMDSLKVIARDDMLEEMKKENYAIEFIGYSAVVIVGIIGFINFINTTITNIVSRKKELSVLESIGLTKKNVKLLLNKEALYNIIISCTLGLAIGIPLSYKLYLRFKARAIYPQYHFPVVPIIIIISFMVILQWICVKITHNKISKGSVIDNIRFN